MQSNSTENLNAYSVKRNTSQLYAMAPIGIGTPLVESLTSYVTRLAEAHCVTAGSLISKIIIPQLSKTYLTNLAERGGTRLYHRSHTINGIGTTAQVWTEVLQTLTGRNDLEDLSWLKWRDIIPSRHLLKPFRSWCPVCFSEQTSSNSAVYEPLIWSVQCITFCSLHSIELADVCPRCGKHMSSLERKTLPGRCSKCNAWLGDSPRHRKNGVDLREQYMFEQVGKLLESNTKIGPSQNGIHFTLNQFVNIIYNGNISASARELDVPKITFWDWITGTNLPTLHDALRLSGKLNINVLDLYTSNMPSIMNNSSDVQPPMFLRTRSSRRNRNLNLSDIQLHLKHATQPQSPIRSLAEISKTLEIDQRVLRKHFPDLCVQIAERARATNKQSSQARKETLIKVVDQTARGLHEQGIYPSRRRVEALMKMPGALREQAAKDAWHHTLTSLGYTSTQSPIESIKLPTN